MNGIRISEDELALQVCILQEALRDYDVSVAKDEEYVASGEAFEATGMIVSSFEQFEDYDGDESEESVRSALSNVVYEIEDNSVDEGIAQELLSRTPERIAAALIAYRENSVLGNWLSVAFSQASIASGEFVCRLLILVHVGEVLLDVAELDPNLTIATPGLAGYMAGSSLEGLLPDEIHDVLVAHIGGVLALLASTEEPAGAVE